MIVLQVLAFIAVIAVAAFALDRLGLWLEERGVIYYRRRERKTGTAIGNALIEVHSLFESDKKMLLEAQRQVKEERSVPGAPPFGDIQTIVNCELAEKEDTPPSNVEDADGPKADPPAN